MIILRGEQSLVEGYIKVQTIDVFFKIKDKPSLISKLKAI